MVNHVLFEDGLWTCDWIINSRLVGSDQTAAYWTSTLSLFCLTFTYTGCTFCVEAGHLTFLCISYQTCGKAAGEEL